MKRDEKAMLLSGIKTGLAIAGEVLLIKILNDYEHRISALEDALKKDIPKEPVKEQESWSERRNR